MKDLLEGSISMGELALTFIRKETFARRIRRRMKNA